MSHIVLHCCTYYHCFSIDSRWVLILYVLPAVSYVPFIHIPTSVVNAFTGTSLQYSTLATTLATVISYVLEAVRHVVSHWFTLLYVCQVQVRLSTYLLSNPVLLSVVSHCCTYYLTFFHIVIHCCTYVKVQARVRTYLLSNPVLLSVVVHCCTYYLALSHTVIH